MKWTIPQLFLTLVSIAMLPACASVYPDTYSAEAIEAHVIDVDTKKPLDDVVVVAHWPLLGGMEGNRPIAQMMVMETVTDQNGRFHFPAWGPLKRPTGYIRHEDPELLFFKPGYRYLVLANRVEGSQQRATESLRRSDWNGKTIELKPFKGSLEEYEKHLSFLKTSLGFAYNGDSCEWKLVPHMLVSQHREKLRLDNAGVFNTLRSVESVAGQKQCGSAKEFYRDYLP